MPTKKIKVMFHASTVFIAKITYEGDAEYENVKAKVIADAKKRIEENIVLREIEINSDERKF